MFEGSRSRASRWRPWQKRELQPDRQLTVESRQRRNSGRDGECAQVSWRLAATQTDLGASTSGDLSGTLAGAGASPAEVFSTQSPSIATVSTDTIVSPELSVCAIVASIENIHPYSVNRSSIALCISPMLSSSPACFSAWDLALGSRYMRPHPHPCPSFLLHVPFFFLARRLHAISGHSTTRQSTSNAFLRSQGWGPGPAIDVDVNPPETPETNPKQWRATAAH